MNKRIKIILIITSILVLLGLNNVFAASGEFSINKTSATVEIGKTTTFTITATNCGGKFTIKSSNTNVATVSVGEEWIENTSKEITITAKSAGTVTITIVADDVASTDEETVSGTKTITVTVPEKKVENNTPPTTPTTPTPDPKPETPPAKSSEARLSNFGITPNDFKGFKRDKYEYSTTVPNDVSEVEVYASPKDSKAKVEGTGKVSLKEGDNTVKVKVTAEDGTTTKTYTLTIKRKTAEEQAKEDGEARLKRLGIKPEEYDFTGFDSEKTEYSVEVPNEVEEIEVYATAMKSSAQITGTGMITLKEGLNELKIESIAADGTKKTYILNVTRKEAEEVIGTTTDIFGLSILTVQGVTLSPKFDTETYEYTIQLNEDLSSLQIGTRPTLDEATVEIIGNENLQQGENIITILVTDEETEESATYQITVNKNIIVEEVEEQMSWLKPSTWGKEEIIKIAIILVLIILIIIAIILKINIAKESDKNQKVEFPGAEELDKAIAEHQELSEENNPQIEQNYIEEIAMSKFGINEGNEEIETKVKRRGRHF